VSSEWEAINELEIGGRNLLLNTSSEFKTASWASWNYYVGAIFPVTGNEYYTASVYLKASSTQSETIRLFFYDANNNISESLNGTVVNAGSEGYSILTVKAPASAVSAHLILRHGINSPNPVTVQYREEKVEKGNKATDWTPAPEDIDKKISDVDAKAQALEYLKLAIGQDAEIDGALVTLVTMLLKEDMNADVTAGISGIQGAQKNLPAFWAGGTDVEAQQGTAKAIIRHDGRAKFEDAEVKGEVEATSGHFGIMKISGNAITANDDAESGGGVIQIGGLGMSYTWFSTNANKLVENGNIAVFNTEGGNCISAYCSPVSQSPDSCAVYALGGVNSGYAIKADGRVYISGQVDLASENKTFNVAGTSNLRDTYISGVFSAQRIDNNVLKQFSLSAADPAIRNGNTIFKVTQYGLTCVINGVTRHVKFED